MIREKPPAIDTVLSFLSSTKMLSELPPSALGALASELQWFRLDDGEVFIHEGVPAHSLYLVYQGTLESFTLNEDGETLVISRLDSGDSLGELAVLTRDRRDSSTRARGESIVARFSQSGLIRLATQEPELMDRFTAVVLRRQRDVQLQAILRANELFDSWSDTSLQDLKTELEWISLKDNEELIHEGDLSDFLAIVVSGRLQVTTETAVGDGGVFAELGSGDTVGEIALFTGAPRTATVKAIRDSELVKLSKSSFDHLVELHPQEMVNGFASRVFLRLWNIMQGLNPRQRGISTLAIVPMSSGVPLADFARCLAQAFAALGKTTHLNSQLVDEMLGVEGISQTKPQDFNNGRIVAWLNEQENRAEFVVLEADPQPTPWSQRCLRQSDLILLLGHAKHDPAHIDYNIEHLEDGSYSTDTRRALVLLHDAGVEYPSGTRRWLNLRSVHSYHHIRENRPTDFERLARRVSGKATGVVLSGGGARGVAHIGALKALEEAGIIIDHIGGNSAGAIISAGYAMGYSTDQLSALAKEMYRPRNFFDPTLPLVSLFSRWRMDRFAREILGDHQIEDLWLPFFCVSSNLTRAEIAVHDQGLMRRWVLASNSLPGLMPPVVKDGDLLLDGALLDNFPLDIMREKIGNGRVIGVDVSPPIDLAENPDFGLHLSGWRVLLSRINPLSTSIKMPGIAAILQRAGELSSKKNQRELLNSLAADLVIRPPVEKFSLTDATALDEIEALGYQSAVEQISAWQRGSGVIK